MFSSYCRSWHRNNFLDFVNWDPFDDDPFEMDFFRGNHDLYFPRIHRALGARHVTVAHPLVMRNDNVLFQLTMNVDGFDPNELSLKLVGRELLIKGIHTYNANQQRPCYSRRFCWRRTLPEDVDVSSVKATLIKPNALEIEAKKIKDYQTQSDIQINVRDKSVDQSQPRANRDAEKQNTHEQSVRQQSSKDDEDATVEIIPEENLNSYP